ncbi:MAG: hypothetical protein FWC89_13390 [Defluviitaleaceae bacterium]|nr:hypothetical protein [Defluviitaleaceae bacterium]
MSEKRHSRFDTCADNMRWQLESCVYVLKSNAVSQVKKRKKEVRVWI